MSPRKVTHSNVQFKILRGQIFQDKKFLFLLHFY